MGLGFEALGFGNCLPQGANAMIWNWSIRAGPVMKRCCDRFYLGTKVCPFFIVRLLIYRLAIQTVNPIFNIPLGDEVNYLFAARSGV